jgi:hypothetical protein
LRRANPPFEALFWMRCAELDRIAVSGGEKAWASRIEGGRVELQVLVD